MHALHALSQGAPAGRRVRRRDMLQKEDASPRRKETRPHEGKNLLTMLGCWAKRTEKTPYDDPRAPPRGVHPGGRSRGPPGGTRGHGPRQGAKSSYNTPRGGGPGPCGHSPYARGRGPWAIGSRGGGAVDARPAPGGHPRPRSPPGSQSAYNAGWNPVPVV